MHEILVSVAIFLCLLAAAFASLVVSERLPARYRGEDTYSVVRLTANIFVVTASLVLGLLLNSARDRFETVDNNLHAFATELVLLDRALRQLGPEGMEVRGKLAAYIQQAITGTWRADGPVVLNDRAAERLLDDVGSTLGAIRPPDPPHLEIWREAQTSFQSVVRRRWVLIEESEGTIPKGFLAILMGWLVIIFANLGFRAPLNCIVGTALVAAALMVAGAIYVVLDMDLPFSGSFQISPAALERAAAQVRN